MILIQKDRRPPLVFGFFAVSNVGPLLLLSQGNERLSFILYEGRVRSRQSNDSVENELRPGTGQV